MRKLVLAAVLAACGPSSQEVRTAKLATYKIGSSELLHLAIDATKVEYAIGEIAEDRLEFITAPRFYSSTGDLESPGAEGYVQLRPGSVQVQFIVQVAPTADGTAAVTVTPKTFQKLSGSPKPRELQPDDPYLPPFVLGRADALQLDIYHRAQQFVVPPPSSP